tara:strand:+ start:234 stop:440 length:207 start_codon:yes stop_codon:yes gene_type:complete
MDEHLLEREANAITRTQGMLQASLFLVLVVLVHAGLWMLMSVATPEDGRLNATLHLERLWMFDQHLVA